MSQMYRKKPVLIEAMQFTGSRHNAQKILTWMGVTDWTQARYVAQQDLRIDEQGEVQQRPDPKHLSITTLEGVMRADVGDWIIRGVQDEFYPCKPDIFTATYEAVPDV